MRLLRPGVRGALRASAAPGPATRVGASGRCAGPRARFRVSEPVRWLCGSGRCVPRGGRGATCHMDFDRRHDERDELRFWELRDVELPGIQAIPDDQGEQRGPAKPLQFAPQDVLAKRPQREKVERSQRPPVGRRSRRVDRAPMDLRLRSESRARSMAPGGYTSLKVVTTRGDWPRMSDARWRCL